MLEVLTKEKLEEMLKEKTGVQCAKELGVSGFTFYKYCHRLGVKLEKGRNKKYILDIKPKHHKDNNSKPDSE